MTTPSAPLPSKRRRTWISILIAAMAVVVVVGIALIASAMVFFYSHVNRGQALVWTE